MSRYLASTSTLRASAPIRLSAINFAFMWLIASRAYRMRRSRQLPQAVTKWMLLSGGRFTKTSHTALSSCRMVRLLSHLTLRSKPENGNLVDRFSTRENDRIRLHNSFLW